MMHMHRWKDSPVSSDEQIRMLQVKEKRMYNIVRQVHYTRYNGIFMRISPFTKKKYKSWLCMHTPTRRKKKEKKKLLSKRTSYYFVIKYTKGVQ